MEELNCETAFTIPVFGGIPVAESVVVTWIIMAVLLLGSIILVRNLKVENVGRKQVVLETVVGGLYNFFYDLLGVALGLISKHCFHLPDFVFSNADILLHNAQN